LLDPAFYNGYVPSSLRRIRASRANGALSKGPKTPEGKRRASLNSLRHGLLADCIVLQNESCAGFEALLAQHLERFGPVDGVEFGLIEEMAAAYWRMRRAWAIEKRTFEDAMAKQTDAPADEVGRLTAAFGNLASSPDLGLLHRYETRLHLMYQRGLHNLLLLRACAPPVTPFPALPPPAETTPDQTNLIPQADTTLPVPPTRHTDPSEIGTLHDPPHGIPGESTVSLRCPQAES